VAPGEHTVLIQGASGTGKELVARELHRQSQRGAGPFTAINCAAIPETLLESELFGYKKGAFTGADRDHVGYFERARGGTLFLDDIDDLPPAVQVKLLRVIQEREVQPVGGRQAVPIDIRLVAATKADLKERVAAGSFREDLYYRLNVIPVKLPLLRQRREDIPELISHFVAKHGGGVPPPRLGPLEYQALLSHAWPGNVRELENVVQRWLALPGLEIRELLDVTASTGEPPPGGPSATPPPDAETVDYREYMRTCERRLLDWALARSGGSVSVAARLLGLPRSTLRSRLED
jgi:DNA-binding NtrC family response regulator